MRIISETGPNFSTYLAARLIFVTVLLGVAAIFRREGEVLPYLLLFACNAVLSIGSWEWYRRHRQVVWSRWMALTSAVALDTLVLYYTGGADSEFLFLYFFSIASAGLLTGLPGGLWTSLLSTAGFIWLQHLDSSGSLARHGLHIFIYFLYFVLTALLTTYVFEKLRERERKHVEALGELQQTRLDTQAILDSLKTGVVVLATEGHVLYSNPASRLILGLDPQTTDEVLRDLFFERTELGSLVRQAGHAQKEEQQLEVTLGAGDSAWPVGFTVSTLHDSANKPRGYIVLFKDLRFVKERERLAREKDRLAVVGALSRDLAHEIRNPLATVRGCVEVMRAGAEARGESGPYFDLALRESDRLNNLLRDFLTFARLDVPRKRPGDLAALIRARLKGDGLDTIADFKLTNPIAADFDAEQMSLIVDAILLTLAEWAERDGHIVVEPAEHSETCVRFLLKNVVIPMELRDEVFQPFSRAPRISNGLALPTALKATHAHGGTLTLKTEASVGTWFELEI
jgi:two-component system, NtrC family, sensor histidine kinase PilS